MPKGGYHPVTKLDLRERIKEIEARIKAMDRREKSLTDLKRWLNARKLSPSDLMWMARQMAPKRAEKAVRSRLPLQPGTKKTKGDPKFMAAIRAKRLELDIHPDALGKKIGVSGASVSNWELGRYVPSEASRVAVLKELKLDPNLGREATAAMIKANGRNGVSHGPGD